MLMVCHHLNPRVPEDLAFAESRIRATTIAAEDLLHDLGAISIIGSDAQAMGRAGETIIRTWQTAHACKDRYGPLPGDGAADNHRARRYVAKYTICPAVAHGIDAHLGSVEPGRLAVLAAPVAGAPTGGARAPNPAPSPVTGRPRLGGPPATPAPPARRRSAPP